MKLQPCEVITFQPYEPLPYIRHGFSTRLGGVSKGEWESMNLSFQRGDKPENVIENYHRICAKLQVDPRNLVFTDQVHDTKVHVATKKDCQENDLKNKKLTGIDALITNELDVVLCTSYADCVPLYFVDQKKRAIGLAHSGWRGTVGKIGAKTIDAMKREYGTDPKDVIAVIGPSICQECYEVSLDVAEAFFEAFGNITLDFIGQTKKEKFQLDLWHANELILLEAGLQQEHIFSSQICTCCNYKWLFSHRASHGRRGNLAAFLSLCSDSR